MYKIDFMPQSIKPLFNEVEQINSLIMYKSWLLVFHDTFAHVQGICPYREQLYFSSSRTRLSTC